MDNKNDENKKRGVAAAKQNPEGDGVKYTPLSRRKIMVIIDDAADGIFDNDLSERIREESEIQEHEDAPGTWFVGFRAKTWREAAEFAAEIIGAAFSRRCYAEASAKWGDKLECKDGGRLVDVFVASADFMTDDGRPVVDAEAEGDGAGN